MPRAWSRVLDATTELATRACMGPKNSKELLAARAMALVTIATCNHISNPVSPPEKLTNSMSTRSCLPAPFASDNMQPQSPRRQHQVRLPTTRSTRYTRSFFFHSALLWNTLPNSIQSHSSTSSFQHAFIEEHWHAYKYLTDTDIRPSPTCLVGMAPPITDGSTSSVSI